MKVTESFAITTNCLGLNFYDIKASVYVILVFHAIANINNFYAIFLYPIFYVKVNWYTIKHIYGVLQCFQSFGPFFIQQFIVFRAIKMRKLQRIISVKLEPKFTQKVGKCEMEFFKRMFFVIGVRAVKLITRSDYDNLIFHLQSTFTELIYSSNDLMFAYYVDLMIENLNFVNLKVFMAKSENDLKVIKREIWNIFEVKREIIQRYSPDLFATIFFHFVLTIISLYWVIMRLVFHHLKLISFLHFPEPFYVYWVIFSVCEKFTRKVKIYLTQSSKFSA